MKWKKEHVVDGISGILYHRIYLSRSFLQRCLLDSVDELLHIAEGDSGDGRLDLCGDLLRHRGKLPIMGSSFESWPYRGICAEDAYSGIIMSFEEQRQSVGAEEEDGIVTS